MIKLEELQIKRHIDLSSKLSEKFHIKSEKHGIDKYIDTCLDCELLKMDGHCGINNKGYSWTMLLTYPPKYQINLPCCNQKCPLEVK